MVNETNQPYAYAGDNAVNGVDPLGLFADNQFGEDCGASPRGCSQTSVKETSQCGSLTAAQIERQSESQYAAYVLGVANAHKRQIVQEIFDQGSGWNGFFQGLGLIAGGAAAVTGIGDILDVGVLGIEADDVGTVAKIAGGLSIASDLPGCFIGHQTLACTGVALGAAGEIGQGVYSGESLFRGLAGTLLWSAATSGTVLAGTMSFAQWESQRP